MDIWDFSFRSIFDQLKEEKEGVDIKEDRENSDALEGKCDDRHLENEDGEMDSFLNLEDEDNRRGALGKEDQNEDNSFSEDSNDFQFGIHLPQVIDHHEENKVDLIKSLEVENNPAENEESRSNRERDAEKYVEMLTMYSPFHYDLRFHDSAAQKEKVSQNSKDEIKEEVKEVIKEESDGKVMKEEKKKKQREKKKKKQREKKEEEQQQHDIQLDWDVDYFSLDSPSDVPSTMSPSEKLLHFEKESREKKKRAFHFYQKYLKSQEEAEESMKLYKKSIDELTQYVRDNGVVALCGTNSKNIRKHQQNHTDWSNQLWKRFCEASTRKKIFATGTLVVVFFVFPCVRRFFARKK